MQGSRVPWIVGAALLAAAAFALFERVFAVGGGGAERLSVSALGIELALAVFALAAAALSRRPLAERLGLGPGRLPGAYVALLALGTLGVSQALDAVIQGSGLHEHSVLPQVYEELRGIRGRTLAAALVGLALAPGVAEELLCRGWIQRGLVPRLGPAGGVVAAAVVFGALHVEPVHAFFAALLGLYLGGIAHLTGSVRAAIVCHAVNNATAVLSAAFGVELGIWTLPSVALGLAVAAGALLAARRRAGRLVLGAGLGAGRGGGMGRLVGAQGQPVAEGEGAAEERTPEE